MTTTPYQTGHTTLEFLIVTAVVAIAAAGAYGWIMNIVKLVQSGLDSVTGLLIARAVGIFFPPLGVVMGYL